MFDQPSRGVKALRLLDRAFRPTAAAVRVLSRETAETNALLRGLTEQLNAQRLLLQEVGRAAPAQDSAGSDSSGPDSGSVEAGIDAPLQDVPLNALYDQWTTEVIGRVLAAGGTGVDVGAHHGDILQAMVANAPSDRHYAFEPIPSMAADLRERFPKVAVHELALAESDGATQFHHVVSNPGYSGLLRRHYDRADESVQIIDVQIRRLDEVLDPEDPVRLIKIDVEGAELGVLKGAERTLARYKPVVVFEFGLGASDVYGTTPQMVHDVFAGHGMRITLLDRWLSGGDPLTLSDFAHEYETGGNYYFLAYPAA